MNNPFLQILDIIIDSAPGGITIKVPHVDHSVAPPAESTVLIRLGASDKQDIITILKRAANKQQLEAGNGIPFDEARYYPDVEGEIRKRIQYNCSDLIQKMQDAEKATDRAKILKEIRLTLKDLKPDVKLKNVEFAKLRAAFKKVNPNISDDEIVALFS